MDNLSNLIKAGFTEYEARVYRELLGEHPATGYQIRMELFTQKLSTKNNLNNLELLNSDSQALENQRRLK